MSKAANGDLPYADSPAAAVLRDAVRRYTEQHAGGLRQLAQVLEINQATVISHMTTGRIGIPLERVSQLASTLDLDPASFARLVLDQRFPSLSPILDEVFRNAALVFDRRLADALANLEPAAPDLEDRISIISEVARDRRPSERWVKLSDLPAYLDLMKVLNQSD